MLMWLSLLYPWPTSQKNWEIPYWALQIMYLLKMGTMCSFNIRFSPKSRSKRFLEKPKSVLLLWISLLRLCTRVGSRKDTSSLLELRMTRDRFAEGQSTLLRSMSFEGQWKRLEFRIISFELLVFEYLKFLDSSLLSHPGKIRVGSRLERITRN